MRAPCLQGTPQFSRLSDELLVQVLHHVGPRHALQSCALVCSSWRAAAAVSVKSVWVTNCSQAKADALTKWLQTHNVLLERLDVAKHKWRSHCLMATVLHGDTAPGTQLLLPAPQLKELVSIRLESLAITSASDAGSPGLSPWLGPALTGVTHLTLFSCDVQLQGLAALTNLQHLDISSTEDNSSLVPAALSNTAVLAEAVPQLLALTFLHLAGGVCQDAAVAHISRLTHLQDLELQQCHCTASSCASLPLSLTRLVVSYLPLTIVAMIISTQPTSL